MAAFRITSEQTLAQMHAGFDAFALEAEPPFVIQDDRDNVYTFHGLEDADALAGFISDWKAANPLP